MSLRIDFHVHSHFSADGAASPERMIAAARRRGLDGFALTDHDTSEGVLSLLDKGLIREDGLPVNDFLIIPAVEVSSAEGHLLCLGVILPKLKGAPVREVCEMVRLHGGLVVPAHPFDFMRSGVGAKCLATHPFNAIEVFNAASTFSWQNNLARRAARALRLPALAGSDAHTPRAIGRSFTILHTDHFHTAGVLAQIYSPNTLHCRYQTPIQSLKKSFHNVFRQKPPIYEPACPAKVKN